MVDVAAALIFESKKFLICQRPANKRRALLWEFPGGKLEAGETLEQCLIRECQEELGVTIEVIKPFMDSVHDYEDISIHLTLFEAKIVEGKPEKLEHNDIRWISTQEIDYYKFCSADYQILEEIKARFSQ